MTNDTTMIATDTAMTAATAPPTIVEVLPVSSEKCKQSERGRNISRREETNLLKMIIYLIWNYIFILV